MTKGIASLETIYLSDENYAAEQFANVIFGCSNDQRNFVFPPTTMISGVLGLSRSRDSLVSQLGHLIGTSFQYCLIPFSVDPAAPSILRFGNDFPAPTGIVQVIPFVTSPRLTNYYLNLLDISVGWHKMGFPPGTFQLKADGSGGCMIDSGAAMTHFDRKAYDPIVKVFEDTFRPHNLERFFPSPQLFELCYKFREDFRLYPTMTFHFEGATFLVDPKYVHYINKDDGFFCVALLPMSGMSILGAWQQTNTLFRYDVNLLHFVSADCTKMLT